MTRSRQSRSSRQLTPPARRPLARLQVTCSNGASLLAQGRQERSQAVALSQPILWAGRCARSTRSTPAWFSQSIAAVPLVCLSADGLGTLSTSGQDQSAAECVRGAERARARTRGASIHHWRHAGHIEPSDARKKACQRRRPWHGGDQPTASHGCRDRIRSVSDCGYLAKRGRPIDRFTLPTKEPSMQRWTSCDCSARTCPWVPLPSLARYIARLTTKSG